MVMKVMQIGMSSKTTMQLQLLGKIGKLKHLKHYNNMKVINALHQLIRDNYDKIAASNKVLKLADRTSSKYWIKFYLGQCLDFITIYEDKNMKSECNFTIPFNEQLWTDFYNELKEALNEN
jgi:hypothetical protein